MPISQSDKELWRISMKDVQPLHDTSVPSAQREITINPKSQTGGKHTWDLHGMTISEAHDLTLSQIDHLKNSHKYVTFITGKSGIMNQEFQYWLDQNPQVKKVELINGGGAYRVWFKKVRHKKK